MYCGAGLEWVLYSFMLLLVSPILFLRCVIIDQALAVYIELNT